MTPRTLRRGLGRDRSSSMRMRALTLGLVGIVSVVLLRPPVALLTMFVPNATAERGAPPVMAGPDAPTLDSVPGIVTDIDDRAAREGTAPLGEVGPDADQGRWGTTPTRPTASGFLIEELRGGWRVEPGNEEAAALAVIAAHAWADALRGPFGPEQGDDGTGATGAIVAIEAVERPGTHHAVITALVAPHGAAGGLRRIAVPVGLGPDGPVLAGPPWQLPAPASTGSPLSSLPLRGTPVGDTELIASARRALDAVGLPGDQLVALEATDGWPFIARLDDDATSHPWLRWHLDRFVVAGLPLTRAGSAAPSWQRPTDGR